MEWSNTNISTPFPVESMNTVDDPYRTYPAATIVACRERIPSTPPPSSSGNRMTPKIVPTPTETSRFEDPSRGSKKTAYRPPSSRLRSTVGSSSSSLTKTPMLARLPRHALMISLEMTSNFCCRSPCVFSAANSPSTSSIRARRTLLPMVLVASEMADKIHEKSPVASE